LLNAKVQITPFTVVALYRAAPNCHMSDTFFRHFGLLEKNMSDDDKFILVLFRLSRDYRFSLCDLVVSEVIYQIITSLTMFDPMFQALCYESPGPLLSTFTRAAKHTDPRGLHIGLTALFHIVKKRFEEKDPRVSVTRSECLSLARHLQAEYQKLPNLDHYTQIRVEMLNGLIDSLQSQISSESTENSSDNSPSL